jgi:hypothetical protein
MTMHESEALGVDIGGVIIDRVSEDDQSYAGAAAVEGAFEAVDRQQVDKAMGTALRVSPS